MNNQTTENGLAYALFTITTDAVGYNTEEITLPFEHKLAKVHVVLKGSDKDKVENVKIKTYTSCTLGTDGTVQASLWQRKLQMLHNIG